jgi:hypothetical protein
MAVKLGRYDLAIDTRVAGWFDIKSTVPTPSTA